MARGRGFGGRGRRGFGRGRFGQRRFGRSRFRGGRGVGNTYAQYELAMDRIANSALTPVIFNGCLNLYGRDTYVTNHLNNFDPQLNDANAQYMQTGCFRQMMAEPIYQEMTVEQYFPNGFQEGNGAADGMNTQTPVIVEDMSGETFGQEYAKGYPQQPQFQQQFPQQQGYPQQGYLQQAYPQQQLPQQQYPQQQPYQQNPFMQQQQVPTFQVDPMFANFQVTPQLTDDALVQEMTRRMQQNLQAQTYTGINALNVVTAGQKLPGNTACVFITMLCAMFLIFPICFMFCDWWKQIVYPFYTVSLDFYRGLGTFLRRVPSCQTLRVTVCDSNFNAEKGQLLYEALMGSQVKNVTFVNLASGINCMEEEHDNFKMNVSRIKELPMTSMLTWSNQVI